MCLSGFERVQVLQVVGRVVRIAAMMVLLQKRDVLFQELHLVERGMVVLSIHLAYLLVQWVLFFFFQAEDGIRDLTVTGVQTCALPISCRRRGTRERRGRALACRSPGSSGPADGGPAGTRRVPSR